MTHKEYNGWHNYETWNVKLWIDNDEGAQEYWNEQAEEAQRAGFGSDETDNGAISRLADQLKTEITDGAPDLGASCYADLLNAALSEVNWYEIAEAMINDNKLEAEEA